MLFNFFPLAIVCFLALTFYMNYIIFWCKLYWNNLKKYITFLEYTLFKYKLIVTLIRMF